MMAGRLLFPRLSGLGYNIAQAVSTRSCSTASEYKFETLKVEKPQEWVFHVELNRPDKMNAMNDALWKDIRLCFDKLGSDENCRAVILSGAGKLFCAGIDFSGLSNMFSELTQHEDVARKAKILKAHIESYQDSLTSLERCPKPVISAIHGACIGAGVDMICSSDIRYCTKDAWFQIKEVDLGLAADVGTLQRLPRLVGNDSLVRELAFSARKIYSDEATQLGFVSTVFTDKEMLMSGALEMAALIASKSPVAVQGTKVNLNYSRNHSVSDGLHFMAHYNMTMLQSEDMLKAAMSSISKSGEPPAFSKL